MTFNLDNPEDYNYDPKQIYTSNEIDEFAEEIKMILNTPKGSVLGAVNMDGDLEEYIWKNKINTSISRDKILSNIGEFSSSSVEFNYSVTIQFAKGVKSDVCIISIPISHRKIPEFTKTLRISLT